MKVIVVRPSKWMSGLLRKFFGIQREKQEL